LPALKFADIAKLIEEVAYILTEPFCTLFIWLLTTTYLSTSSPFKGWVKDVETMIRLVKGFGNPKEELFMVGNCVPERSAVSRSSNRDISEAKNEIFFH
jgi:hypothetical protein